MDFTDNDMRVMAQQGDAVNFVRFAAGLPMSGHSKDEESIPCPWCHAPARQRCTTPKGHLLREGIHEARIHAYHFKPRSTEKKPGAWPGQGET